MCVRKIDTIVDRRPIYKEVLQFLLGDEKTHPKWNVPISAGLCILLACSWGNISWEENFIDAEGNEFMFTETFNYFPEMGQYYIDGCCRYCDLYETDPIGWRIKILTEIVCT